MAIIGNGLTTQSFTGGMDQFNGNGSNTSFSLTRTINSPLDVDVYVENVWQRPGIGYNATSNTVTFTSAPSTGSNNVVVVYRAFNGNAMVPQDGSVSTTKLGTITNINAGTNADLTLQANNTTMVTVAANGALNATGSLTTNGNITAGNLFRRGSYFSIGKGPANNDQITWNALPDNAGNYTPMWTGNSTAGGTIMGMPSGGNGGLEIRALRFGTNSAPQAQSAYPVCWNMTDVGIITTPLQPSFYAYHSTNPTPTNSSLFVFDSTNYNSGMYSTSTGRMTAPVAGRYLVSAAFRVNNQNAGYYAQTLLFVNGASTWQGSYHNSTMSSGAAGYNTVIYTGILSLGQGDYVQPYWTVQAGTTVFSGTESWFSGHLLG